MPWCPSIPFLAFLAHLFSLQWDLCCVACMVLYSLYLKTLVAPRSYPCIIFIQFKVIQVCSLYSTQPFLFGSSGSRPMHQVTIRGSCTQNIFYFTLMLKMHKGKKTKFICPCLACLPIEVPKTHRYVGSKAPPFLLNYCTLQICSQSPGRDNIVTPWVVLSLTNLEHVQGSWSCNGQTECWQGKHQ